MAAILIFLQSLGRIRLFAVADQQRRAADGDGGLRAFLGSDTSDWSGVMTYASVYVTPILIVFVLLQRRIISGLTAAH